MNDRPTIQDLRCFVDGELDDGDRTEIEARLEHDDELRRQVEFERRLRDRVGEIMMAGTSPVPETLAARVRAALADAEVDPAIQSENDEPVASRVGHGEVSTRPSRTSVFAGPPRANVFAIAATLAIVAGAVLFGIFGRPVDDVRQLPSIDVLHQSAAFVSNEHNRCAGSEANRRSKLKYVDQATAAAALSRHLMVSSIPSFDLSALGYTFVGGGECGVPAADRSAHFMFRRDTPADDGTYPMVSIFMVPDNGQLDIGDNLSAVPGVWTECTSPACDHHVIAGSNGELAFFVCCCIDDDLPNVAKVLGTEMTGP